MTDQITAAIETAKADPAIIYNGARWYPEAERVARTLGKFFDVDPLIVSGIISALSSNTSWRLNIRNTVTFLRTHYAPTLGLSVRKANRILSGEAIEDVLAPAGVNKTRSFFLAIAGDVDSIVIDRHMLALLDLDIHKSLTKKQYLTIQDQYRSEVFPFTRKQLGFNLPDRDVQAVLWTAHRNSHL